MNGRTDRHEEDNKHYLFLNINKNKTDFFQNGAQCQCNNKNHSVLCHESVFCCKMLQSITITLLLRCKSGVPCSYGRIYSLTIKWLRSVQGARQQHADFSRSNGRLSGLGRVANPARGHWMTSVSWIIDRLSSPHGYSKFTHEWSPDSS